MLTPLETNPTPESKRLRQYVGIWKELDPGQIEDFSRELSNDPQNLGFDLVGHSIRLNITPELENLPDNEDSRTKLSCVVTPIVSQITLAMPEDPGRERVKIDVLPEKSKPKNQVETSTLTGIFLVFLIKDLPLQEFQKKIETLITRYNAIADIKGASHLPEYPALATQ